MNVYVLGLYAVVWLWEVTPFPKKEGKPQVERIIL